MQSGIFISRLRSHLYYLSVIVTLAPLLGLLGTISGMIRSFSIFNVQSGQAIAITGGIGEALIATAFGLCVAILAWSSILILPSARSHHYRYGALFLGVGNDGPERRAVTCAYVNYAILKSPRS